MLVIRESQIDAFPIGLEAAFEKTAVDTVRDLFPEVASIPGVTDEHLLRMIRYGFSVAAEYGIDDEQNILLFVSFMFLFGFQFDTNPNLPWASEILHDPELDATEKMALLYDNGSVWEAEMTAGEEKPPLETK